MQPGARDDIPQERELGDASVLDLDVPKTIEAGLARLVEQTEGIEEAEGRLCAQLRLECVQCGDGGSSLGYGCWCECGGRADEEGADDGFHGENGGDGVQTQNP